MDNVPPQTQQIPFTQDQNQQMKVNMLETIMDFAKAAKAQPEGGVQNAVNTNRPESIA